MVILCIPRIPCETQEGTFCDVDTIVFLNKHDVKYPKISVTCPIYTAIATILSCGSCSSEPPCPHPRKIHTEGSGVAYSPLHSQVSLLLLLFTSESVPFRPICRSNNGSAQISASIRDFRETCHRVQVASVFLTLINWSERVLQATI